MRLLKVVVVGTLLVAVTGPAFAAGVVPKRLANAAVVPTHAWPSAVEALIAAHRQTGLRYAVVPATFRGVVGPFQPGQRVDLGALVTQVAAATGTVVRVIDDVVVFDPNAAAAPRPEKDPRRRVHQLSLQGDSTTVVELSKLVDHDDASVGVQALAALHRLEGDFMRSEWPGRVSILEVLRDRLDREALLWAISEGHREGSPSWQRVVEVLGRAREPYMHRHAWGPIWYKTPGTMRVSLWAIGRTQDSTAGRTLGKRIRNSFTNHPADRYLAAVSAGRIGLESELRRNTRSNTTEVRRASVLGLGLCRESGSLLAQLDRSLRDKDPGVRYLACQSLGRVGTAKALATLKKIIGNSKAATELRCAALDGLGMAVSRQAVQIIVSAAKDGDPAVRAKVAELLGRIGGTASESLLLTMLADRDRWVRAAAAFSLGRIGSDRAVDAAAKYTKRAKLEADNLIAAINGLGRGRSPRAADALGRIALDVNQDRRVRRYAVLALAALANRAGQDTLKKLTAFGTPQYMQLALRHLELATPEATAKHVIPFLARGSRDTSAGAACRLAELANAAGVRELMEGSDVFDNHSRMMHMWGVIRAQGPEIIPMLVRAAGSKRSVIRSTAALALGGRTDVAAVDALLKLATDKSSGVRFVAAQGLGLCGDPIAIPVLVKLAETDDNSRVVASAIRALRQRTFSSHPAGGELFAKLAGTERDAGVITPNRPSLKDQPANSFALRRWAGAIDDDAMCNITYETSLAYDSRRGRVVLWGAHGRRADAPQTGQTWFFRADTGKWSRLITSREWPNATCCVWGLTYDPANQVVISPTSGRGGHGWVNALRVNMQYSHPWLLDARTDQWYPVKPSKHKGAQTGYPGTFDPRHAVNVWWGGGSRVKAYDAYSNEWWTMSLSGRANAQRSGTAGGRFDPKTGLYIVVGDRSTWAYDPTTSGWTDLKPKGSGLPGCRMVYDSANDVMLQFGGRKGGSTQVAAYHIRENRWERPPAVHPTPRYGTFDVAYDAKNNVTVISGGWDSGRSGIVTVRETWTYRYKPAKGAEAALGRPTAVTVKLMPNGRIEVAWKPPRAGKVAGYRVYRGVGRPAWKATWSRVARLNAGELVCAGIVRQPTEHRFYRVAALGPDGAEGPASYPIRTSPPAVRWTAAVFTGDGVRVNWPASGDKNVIGYHVYRAPVPARSHWARSFNPMDFDRTLKRITTEPVKGTEFLDKAVEIKGPASELEWPDSFVYAVRAVNSWGLEGGQGPTTLAVPDAPGLVRVIPWLDGRRLVMWSPGRGQGVSGYFVTRQDDWNRKYGFRWHAAPQATFGFWDGIDFPTADRRRYYVSGVDVLGTVGIPSSGAWSHGFP